MTVIPANNGTVSDEHCECLDQDIFAEKVVRGKMEHSNACGVYQEGTFQLNISVKQKGRMLLQTRGQNMTRIAHHDDNNQNLHAYLYDYS